jgi:hypothetical protein
VVIGEPAMALAGKVKTALDETRTLILGAQILLGFQFQGAFQDRFDLLPNASRNMSVLALLLLLLTVGLLIAPSAFHRLAEQGQATGRIHVLAGYFAATALLPFAGALGLDLTITLRRAWGEVPTGTIAGIAFAALAAAGWYGWGLVMRGKVGITERNKARSDRSRREPAKLHARIDQMLTEARVVLPGAQALLGFQLVIVLNSTFEKLPETSRLIHGVALLAVALAVILLITPAALHRIVWAGEENEALLTTGGSLTILALLPLSIGMAGDAYVVLERITGMTGGSAIAAAIVLLVLLAFWFAWPLLARTSGSFASTKSSRDLQEANQR